MSNEQRIRAFLFYLSLTVFLLGLPFILSFALGYKFNRRTFGFTKTGLIAVRTQPSGASIYLDNRLLNEKTPATIDELLPGKYLLGVKLDGCYPYAGEINVEAEKVTRLEKIILFSVRPDIKQLNKERISHFFVDEVRGLIYYINQEDNSLYKSDLEGEHFEKIAGFLTLSQPPSGWKISPDKESLLYFSNRQIGLMRLEPDKKFDSTRKAFILDCSFGIIREIFWYSDSYHLVLVRDDGVDILEMNPDARPLALLSFEKKDTAVFYDARTDALYFIDSQKAADGRFYDNLYKLELNAKLNYLNELMRPKKNE